MSTFVHPTLLAALANFFASTVTIQQRSDTLTTSGYPNPAWAALGGHSNLKARIAPAGASGREVKAADGAYSVVSHTVVLAGNYPTITPLMRAVDDGGKIYDVLAVEWDDEAVTTRLATRIVT